jgi:hypothetical protein
VAWLALALIVVVFGAMGLLFAAQARAERRRIVALARLAIELDGRFDTLSLDPAERAGRDAGTADGVFVVDAS